MADRRRRRKVTGSGDSDEVSESSEDENPEEKLPEPAIATELVPEKGNQGKVAGESEYESAEEEGEDDEEGESDQHTQDIDPDVENPVDEEGGQEETAEVLEEDDIEGGVEWKDEQREEGDGEESEIEHSKEKSLDFDEDRRNPQYIPKKGGFYEHDDRLNEVIVTEESEKKLEETDKKKNVKKLWKDEGKWIHDRYHETEQNPKSTNELVTIYGYDIRNEEGPPHARRRRRYGRGPSKYTRKWEDEDAYNNGMPAKGRENENVGRGNFRGRRGSRGRGGGSRNTRNEERDIKFEVEEFPRLESKTVENSAMQSGGDGNIGNTSRNEEETQQRKNASEESNKISEDSSTIKRGSHEGMHSQRRPIRGKNRFGRTPWAQHSPPASVSSDTANFQRGRPTDLVEGMRDLNCNDDNEVKVDPIAQGRDRRRGAKGQTNQRMVNSSTYERRQASIPPRLQDAAANKPKRYSSQRQRSTPDNAGCFQPNSTQQNSVPPRFYDQCFQQSVYPDRSNSSRNQSANANMMAPASYQGYEPPYQDSYGIRPIANSPRMFSPVSLPAGQPVIPAPYVTSGGNLMGYGPPPAPYPQYPFQPYTSTATATVGDPHDNTLSAMHSSPPQEIFRGGMAYYNTQPPVRIVHKRPRAAIPILPPPEMEGNGEGSVEDLTEEIDSNEMMENGNKEILVEGEN